MKLILEFASVSILILYSIVKGQEDTCVPFPDNQACGCTFKDGKIIDLRSLGNQDGHPA